MTLVQHSALSAVGAVPAFILGGPASAAAFFIVGVFIDLDHVLEYWLQVAFPSPKRLKHFFSWFSEKQSKKLWLVLHAWEWVAAGFVIVFIFDLPAWIVWGLAGWTFHLVLDQLSNGMHPLGYFFVFRYLKNFDGPTIGNHRPG